MRHRYVFQCQNATCSTTLVVERERRPVQPLCHACAATTRLVADVPLPENAPRLDMGDGVAMVATPNRPHSQWLKVVDRITKKWLVAELAYADTTHNNNGARNMAFVSINAERDVQGLPPLTWDDVPEIAQL